MPLLTPAQRGTRTTHYCARPAPPIGGLPGITWDCPTCGRVWILATVPGAWRTWRRASRRQARAHRRQLDTPEPDPEGP